MEHRLGRDIDFRELGASAGEGGDAHTPRRGYLAVPATACGPGVVVLHEAWGLDDEIRNVCDRLAREGFVALAPDLYDDAPTRDHDVAHRRMLELQVSRAQAQVDASIQALLAHDAVEGARVGCLGFCMGGQLALAAATQNPRIGAVVDCYGVHPEVTLELDGLEAAVLGIFAEHDEWISEKAVAQLGADLTAADKRHHFKIHLGVKHAFMNASRPEVYDAATASEAWNELLAFLHAELA